MLSVGDHRRATGAAREEYGEAVYRVVGTGDPVALLRVTDGSGRRVHTGDLRPVPRERLDDSFEAVADPEGGFRPRAALRNAAQGLYWNVRKFFPP